MNPPPAKRIWHPRLATENDVPSLERLIPLSVRKLQAPWYSHPQMEAALGPVFAVDRELIRDRTYFVVEDHGEIVGCGGWSRRQSHFGGDAGRSGSDALLDPAREPARIRAFFVHPDRARQGIARQILSFCERAIVESRFGAVELVATLAGEPFYARHGYAEAERFYIPMARGLRLAVVRMRKTF